MYKLILPLGIINMVLVAFQLLSGLRVIKVSFKTHKYLGITLAITAFCHGLIAVIS